MSAADPASDPASDPGTRASRPADAPLFPQTSKRKSSSGGGWVVGGLVAVLLVGLVAAGVVFGPRLLRERGMEVPALGRAAAVRPATRPTPAPTGPAPAAAASSAGPAAGEVIVAPEAVPAGGEVGRLTAEIERLMVERYAAQAGEQARAVQAAEAAAAVREAALRAELDRASAALAAQRRSSATAAAELTDLMDAAFSAQPFVPQAAALVRRLPGNADAEALLALSAQGAPSRAELADGFARAETAAARAARRPGGSWTEQALHALTGGAMLRREHPRAVGADGALARAAARVRAGELEAAAAELARASSPVPEATAGWRDAVRRRLEIDRRMAAVRDAALTQAAVAPAVGATPLSTGASPTSSRPAAATPPAGPVFAGPQP